MVAKLPNLSFTFYVIDQVTFKSPPSHPSLLSGSDSLSRGPEG